MQELDGKEMGGSHIEVSLAKPPSDKKKKEEILRARERRMMQMMQVRGGYVFCFWYFIMILNNVFRLYIYEDIFTVFSHIDLFLKNFMW